MQRSALLKSRLEIVLIYKTTIVFLCAPPNVHKRLETKTPSPLQFQRKPVFASIAAFFLNDIPDRSANHGSRLFCVSYCILFGGVSWCTYAVFTPLLNVSFTMFSLSFKSWTLHNVFWMTILYSLLFVYVKHCRQEGRYHALESMRDQNFSAHSMQSF